MDTKKVLLHAVKIAVSIGLIVFLLVKISPARLGPLLTAIDPVLLLAAVVVFFLSSLLGAVQWYILLRTGGIVLRFRLAFRLYFVGLFFNNFLPANVGGDAVKIYDIVRVGNDPYQVFAITLLDRIIGITALCLLALAASVSLLPFGRIDNIAVYMLIFIACITPVLALILNRRLSKWVRRLFGMIRIWGLGKRFEMVFDHLGSFRNLRSMLLRLILLALAVQFLRVVTHLVVGRSLGIELTSWNFVHFYVFIPLLGLVMVLPVSLNGLGVREGAGILLFTTIGFSEEQALLMEFITYVVMVAVSLIGGLFFLGRQFRRRTE